MAIYQLKCDALTYRAFAVLSIVCHKVTEEWGEGFEEHVKEGRSF